MREYELACILSPELEQSKIDSTLEDLKKVVKSLGGEVNSVNAWGVRRFAYPIRKKKEGYYVFLNLQLPPDAIKKLDHTLKFNEMILRHLIIKTQEE
ncbi:MAG: 30S ribosomal protein S6 [Anaerolineae bacterium]|nr:30S ribosomal protein S6 [Anaerolineae bacterium]